MKYTRSLEERSYEKWARKQRQIEKQLPASRSSHQDRSRSKERSTPVTRDETHLDGLRSPKERRLSYATYEEGRPGSHAPKDEELSVSKKKERNEGRNKSSRKERSRSRSRGDCNDSGAKELKKKRRRSKEESQTECAKPSADKKTEGKKQRKRDRHIDLDEVDSGPTAEQPHPDSASAAHSSEKPLSPRDARCEKRAVIKEALEAGLEGNQDSPIDMSEAAPARKPDRWGNDGFFELEATAMAARAAAEERRRARLQQEKEARYAVR